MTRRRPWGRVGLSLAIGALLCAAASPEKPRRIDDFEDVAAWHAATYPGASLEIHGDEGHDGRGMRLDFDFHGSRGYVIARRTLDLRLPADYALSFWMRAEAPVNTLEFKLVDAGGHNVWWRQRRNFTFPTAWTRVVIRRSQLTFAWGPEPQRELRRVGAIEIAISAGSGGRGSVWIDGLTLEPRQPTDLRALRPSVRASSSEGAGPGAALDGDPATAWHSAAAPAEQWLEVDLGRRVEYGGLVIQWQGDDAATAFRVLASDDASTWTTAYETSGAGASRSYIALPDGESRYLRLELLRSRGRGYGVSEIELEPYGFSESANDFFEAVARNAPRGHYPRMLLSEQAYWTVVGADGAARKALLDEDGRLEVNAGRFSIEPFLRVDGRLVTWADAQPTQELVDGELPIPSVVWQRGPLELRITAFATGDASRSTLYARYRVRNTGLAPARGSLYLALRPFQVNPPWQSLNLVGGVAPIHQIARSGRVVRVDGDEEVLSLVPPDGFGALAFEAGDLAQLLAAGRLPESDSAADAAGYASGALRYALDLAPGDQREVWLAIPFDPPDEARQRELEAEDASAAAALQDATERFWRERLARIRIELPGRADKLARTLRTTVAYILVNRRGPALQPGARDYARSWIRDGALTSSALLEMGYPQEVRDFLRWYAQFQFEDGHIPCCVDQRGPDPVAEHDSNGEFIYAITDYYMHTRDRAFLEEMWPRVVKAVAYIGFLRLQSLGSGPDHELFHGLAPKSISHEGYSSHPVHSYWDDFFLLRGLKDAVVIARELGDEVHASAFAALRDAFRADLYASIHAAVARHNIDFIPGSVELGDFDPTSTSIAISPGGELHNLPPAALARTFERYFSYFLERRSGEIEWKAYTPYEIRNVGSLIRLGQKHLALEALDFFVADQRPPAWNQWAEVVWREPRTPAFIGDMPHTWVGSGFVRSLRSALVYEREEDRTLVLAAGVPRQWVDTAPGVRAEGLSTEYGTIGYTMQREGNDAVRVHITGEWSGAPAAIELDSPYDRPLVGVSVDGRDVRDFARDHVAIADLPADVLLRY